MAMGNITFDTAPNPQEPSPIADEIIATISNAPAMRYVIWNRVLGTLRMAPPEGRTPARIVELLQPAIRQEDDIWAWLEIFDKEASVEKLMQVRKQSLAWRIRDLMGLDASHQDALQTIKEDQPYVYGAQIKPLFFAIRKIKSADKPEVEKIMLFETFKSIWRTIKRELKSNKLAPRMREYLDRLEGSPLRKREDISNSHGLQQHGDSSIIDLTMD